MTQLQREAIDSAVRASPLDLGGHPLDQRPLFEQMVTAVPIPDDVVTTPGHLGGVPVISLEIAGLTIEGVILYFHGGSPVRSA
jgi:epsilon-lactone hydrolase